MKKGISLILFAIFVFSSTVPTAAQKGRATELKKKQVAAPGSTTFADFQAYTDGNGVYLAWQMEAEVGNIGFHVYRVAKEGAVMLSPEKLVAGAAMHARERPSYGAEYEFYDRSGTAYSAYYVEAISLNGAKIYTRQIYPQYVSDLRSLSGKTSADLAAEKELGPARIEQSIVRFMKEIAGEIEENQLLPDPTTHRTVISQPGVVRIGVRGEGIVRVMRSQLEAAGFNVNSDSTFWQLYVEGNEQGIIIGPNAEYIEFFGKGTDTRETDIRQYYLAHGASSGKRIDTRVARPNTSTVVTPNYFQTFVKKERTNYVDDIDNGDLENYFGRGFGSGVTTMTFNLSGVDLASPNAGLHLRFQGYSNTNHLVEVTLNDNILAPAPGPTGEVSFTADYAVPTSFLLEGANNIKFRAAAAPGDFVFFDVMSIDFGRKFLADGNKLSFYTQNYRAAKLDGFSSANVRVFDLTNEASPTLMTNLTFEQDGSTFGTKIPAARGRSFFAVENSAILAPFSVTPNDPELVGIPTNSADLVIISHKDLMPEAEAWANYRRGPGQNFTVKVIEVSELFDEFNYGTFSSTAVSNFLQYAHENWQDAPEYALVIGDASVDSRNYENQGYWNMVPPTIASAVFTEVASDEALADFDNDGLAEIAIGRIASRNAVGVTTVLTKVVNWEQLVSPLDRGALFAFDHNVGYDFDGMSLRVRNQLPAKTPSTLVYRGDPNANTTLVNEMNMGKYIVNYAGHGTTGSWGGNPVFFNILTVPTLQDNPNNPALFTMLTCLNGAYHYLFNDSFAEVLTKSPNRGAVAAWASTGLTLPNIQERMATRFYLKIGEGDIPRLGDLIRDAKTVLTLEDGGADVRRSWALIGDPMLKVR
jgi:hypothetical protein